MKKGSDNAISKLLPLSTKVLKGIFNMAASLPEESQQCLATYFQIVVNEQKVLEELHGFAEGDTTFLEKFESLVSYMNQASSFPAERGKLDSGLEAIRQDFLSRKGGDLSRQQEELFLALEVFSEYEWVRLDEEVANDPAKMEVLYEMVEEALAGAQPEENIFIRQKQPYLH